MIFQNLFFLSRWGLDTEYLVNAPLDEFYYYIKLFNQNKKLLGLGGGEDNVGGVSNPPPETDPKPIGSVIPNVALPS